MMNLAMMNGLMMASQKANLSDIKVCDCWCNKGCAYAMLIGLLAILPTNVLAQNNKHSCTIIVDNTPGTMRQNANTTILASTQAGGQAARAQIIATNSSYRASIDAPTGFSVFPNNGNNNTEFSASFSSTGATQFLSSPSDVERKIKKGTSNISVHMSAKRFSGSFPAGNYAATVTLRCE